MIDLFARMREIDSESWKSGLFRQDTTSIWTTALPALPEEHEQRRFVGKAYEAAFLEAYEVVETFVRSASELGKPAGPEAKLLDFGCGWGRITQACYRYFSPANIIAADIQSEALELCRMTGINARLMLVDNASELDIPDGSLDHIFAFSVFSHLSEELHWRWLSEFNRILKPGGILAVSTRTASIIQHAMSLAQKPDEIPPHGRGLAEAFADADTALAELEKGEFVFRSYPFIAKSGEGYGEAIIPEDYVRKNWHIYFSHILFYPPQYPLDQSIIVAKKIN